MAAKSVSAIFATEIEASIFEGMGSKKKGKKGKPPAGAKRKARRHIIIVIGKGGKCKGTNHPDGTTVWVCSASNK